ncbi:MAG: hypothetical protein RLZZ28_559 [Bacteroidota bacterium]|jgi:hypothetical protein
MKRLSFLVVFTGMFFCAISQSKTNGTASKNSTTKPPAQTKTAAIATPTEFESQIVYGKLILTKTIIQGDGQVATIRYTLSNFTDRSLNNRKPISVAISKNSFDSVFTKTTAELAAKYPSLNKFIAEKNISLADEKGWIAVLNYYNSLN